MTTDELQKLRGKGFTYGQIGELAGLSKQRVHQILAYGLSEYNQKHREYERKRRGFKKAYRTKYNPEGK